MGYLLEIAETTAVICFQSAGKPAIAAIAAVMRWRRPLSWPTVALVNGLTYEYNAGHDCFIGGCNVIRW